MPHRAEGSGVQLSDMPLAGLLAFSATALLLLMLAYRYFKSRGPPSSTPAGAADANVVRAERREWQVGNQKENKQVALRHRGERRKETEPCHPGTNQLVQVGGCGVTEACGQAPIPAGRELPGTRETEAETKQEAGEVSRMEPGVEQGWRSEDKAGDPCCTIQNCTSKAGADLDNLGDHSGAVGLLSRERELYNSMGSGWDVDLVEAESSCAKPVEKDVHSRERELYNSMGSGWDVDLVEAESSCAKPVEKDVHSRERELYNSMGSGWDVDLVEAESSCAKPVEKDVHPTGGSGIGLKRGEGQPLGKETKKQIVERRFGPEKIQSFYATSDMDLAINHSHVQSHVAYAFSSVAKVEVEENFIKEKQSSGKAEDTQLRGKVYNYYVESTSQSIMNKTTFGTNLDFQRFCNLSTIDILNVSKKCWAEEPVCSSVTKDEANKLVLEKVPDISSNVLLSPAKDTQPKDQRETVAVKEAISSKPLLGRRSISRKESFKKIVDNPELQVSMEGFGSPGIGPSSGHTSPPALLHLDSTSSLVKSMQNFLSSGREEPSVKLVAGAKFFHVPLSSDSSLDIHLDLGNCYQVLCMAKKQKLKDLQEAVYKVMSDNYIQVLKTQAIYRQLNAAERDLILEKRMRGKKYMTVADVGCHTSGLSYYDDQKDAWHPLTHIPVEAISKGCAICSMFNYLFVVAGCEGFGRYQKPSNRVFCYNPLTDIWQEICPLNQARPHCKLVALDGCLYAIGGECLYTVEQYDPRLDRWTFAAPLPNDTFAVAHTATVCDGEICVTGGTLRYMLLRYVRQTDTWKVNLTGGSQDRTTEMVTVNGFIYRFDLNQRMGISAYRCSAKAKLWYECATHPMSFPSCFQCAVVGNLVYCVNRQFNLRFLADLVSPRFGSKELRNFPSPRGALIPVTLMLPEGYKASQTRV